MEEFERAEAIIKLEGVDVSSIANDSCPASPLVQPRSILKMKNVWHS